MCAPVAIAFWLLFAAFWCDWSFDLPMTLRGVVLLAWVTAGLWAIRKFAWPLVTIHETEQDVALLVEQQHKIDTDLVAALQFEQPQAATWGSSRLEQAVVDYVAEFSPSLNVFDGFTYGALPRRATALVVTLLVVIGVVVAFPMHAAAFWNRFLLGTAHYPTKTRIAQIVVNGIEVPVFHHNGMHRIRIPYGQEIRVHVKCGGVIPASGFANLSGIQNDAANRVELAPSSPGSAEFGGEIAHVAESFRVRFHFGDAASDPAEIVIIPLPLVDIAWEVTPPQYALATMKASESESGSRQLAVLEGSAARLSLNCSNKPLKSASLTIGTEPAIELVKAVASSTKGSVWILPEKTSLDSIRHAFKYEIQVVDDDGLSLESPITGQIRLKSDRLPRIVASAVTRQVLPTAAPKLDYAAGDDFGVAKIVAVIQISREDGTSVRHELMSRLIEDKQQPQTIIRGQIPVPLSPYELQKGDEVKVTLEVTDWRGGIPGQKGFGEPITFNVTDLNGILAQTGDEDKKTAKQLDEILRRELGIGGERK